MKSQLADAARRSLSEDVKRMTPEQRLAAFLAHCQLMAQLHVQAQPASSALDAWQRRMRTSAPGQSALLMADVAELLATQGVRYAVIGAMAAAVHGVVRASLDADAIVALQVREAQAPASVPLEEGYEAVLRAGDVDDPIPALLEVRDRHGNRVDLAGRPARHGSRSCMNRTRQVTLAEAILEIVGREDFIAMKAFAGGPVDLADARAVIDLDRESLISNYCVGWRSDSVATRRVPLRTSSAPWTEASLADDADKIRIASDR